MSLRCLLFSSDEGTSEPIRQVLSGLGVEGEFCSDAAEAVEKVTHQSFQIVVIDWEKQPEAGLLLTAARERKAAERPLTLAIVSDDGSVPKALQAGANSILRKPFLGNQLKDTLTTARDLLRAKQESAAAATAGASAGSSATLPACAGQRQNAPLLSEESRESSSTIPKVQSVARSHAPEFVSHLEAVDSSKNVDSLTAALAGEKPAPVSPLPQDGPRGLEWYLKTRAGTPTETTDPESAAPTPPNSELLGFDHMPLPSQPKSDDLVVGFAAESDPKVHGTPESPQTPKKERPQKERHKKEERNKEAELFAYMAGKASASEHNAKPRSRLKGAIIAALVLAGGATIAAPQAPWHSKMRGIWLRGQQTMHGWLNPQPVNPVQAPVAHEDFGRAGDEYKLPVEENIPDATTDPSQIQVVPVVDPTAKKPNNEAANPAPPAILPDEAGAATSGQSPAPEVQVPENQLSPSNPETQPAPTVVPTVTGPLRSDPPAAPIASDVPSVSPQSVLSKNPQPHHVSSPGNVPSSLKSQLASMTPDASGNRAPETAMDSIEPVAVAEATERALLTEQPALDYPANAKGQHGTVILQVLIGRDGTVQDAKFMQGSLAFAKAAIDGVKQWKFKPYAMNGRAVSVQTLLTMSFKPAP